VSAGSSTPPCFRFTIHVHGWPGIINASIVATGDGPYGVTDHTNTADRLIAINTAVKTGTFVLAQGFANDMPVLYLSTEASVALPSALDREATVLAGNLEAKRPYKITLFGSGRAYPEPPS
jgi:hypothetical protein